MNEKFEHNGVSELITKQWAELKNVHTRIRGLKSHPLRSSEEHAAVLQ